MSAVYNEIDPYAVKWLENLIQGGHISPGRVESRSIADVTADDIKEAEQFHTFAGIGLWSLAFRWAGIPDDAEVWSGSCPCQPYSNAGKQGGTDDERHLWPEWFRLIKARRPPLLFGEQVASAMVVGKAGVKPTSGETESGSSSGNDPAWLDAVFADLEGEGYACAAALVSAAGVGAPHIRQRVFFGARSLADDDDERRNRTKQWLRKYEVSENSDASRRSDIDGCGQDDVLGDADDEGPQGWCLGRHSEGEQPAWPSGVESPWRDTIWIPCRDGRVRPIESGTFPLSHGLPRSVGLLVTGMGGVDDMAGISRESLKAAKENRVGRLRAYGNAIVPYAAVTFIRSFLRSIRG